jgi:protein-S-isoprenylcysteine O-methyltransferase Ste14
MTAGAKRLTALVYGSLAHGLFLVGVAGMAVNLHEGMLSSLGTAHGPAALAANALLILQFPILHSFLLSRRGRAVLARLAPGGLGGDLSTTTFSGLAAIQIALTFLFWSPGHVVWWKPHGAAAVVMNALFVASWAFLGKALYDAGLPLQTGALGWTAVFRGRRPEYSPFPTQGLFRLCRQPVYLGFAATLWTGPVWTPDHLALAILWTAYCVVGPRLKERRYARRHGEAFQRYQSEVPYMLPRLRRAV